MLRLDIKKTPFKLDLSMGVSVTVRPLTSAVYYQAKAYLQRSLQELKKEIEDRKKIGASLEGLPDLDLPDVLAGVIDRKFTLGLGLAGIIDWEGVLDSKTDKKAVLSPKTLEELFENFWVISWDFSTKYTSGRELAEAEKKK